MITYEDQMNLFSLIAKQLKRDIACYAFGGNAMMFYGYKDETKDVDLLFEDNEQRKEFISALGFLGYSEHSPITIYIPEKLRDPHRPLMYRKGDGRFDLFAKKIFKTIISPKIKENLFAVHEFKGTHTLKVNVLRK